MSATTGRVDVVAPATVILPAAEPPKPAQVGDTNIAPTTTAAEDLIHSGQRRINLIWELTQAGISVTIAVAFVCVHLFRIDAPALDAAFFWIGGTYYARTNHQRIGGVGSSYAGR